MQVLEDVETLLKTSADELEKMLSSKTVMGEAATVGDVTIVPLLSAGFWFGAGGLVGKGGETSKAEDEGSGGGTGGAGDVKAVAMLIFDKNGVRVEAMKGSLAQMTEQVREVVPKVEEAIRPQVRSSGGELESCVGCCCAVLPHRADSSCAVYARGRRPSGRRPCQGVVEG